MEEFMKSWARVFPLALVALTACAQVLSKEVLKESVRVENFARVRQAPGEFEGKTIVLGGEVLEARNRPEGTTLVVLERQMDRTLRPRDLDLSGGRFMVRFSEYLDPAIYSRGRLITVAGKVEGTLAENVGEVPYSYLLLEGRECYLWRESYETRPSWYEPFNAYPYPWWYDPYWGRRPWH